MKLLLLILLVQVGFSETTTSTTTQTRPTTSNPVQYASQGPVAFSSSGAAYLPTNVVNTVSNGGLSGYIQMAMQEHLMNQCLKDVLARTPTQRDPYVRAKALFDQGICQLSRCYQQMMALDSLSQSSSNPQNGGSADPQVQQGQAQASLAMMTSLSKQGSCESGQTSQPNPQKPSIDPYMMQVAQQKLQGLAKR